MAQVAALEGTRRHLGDGYMILILQGIKNFLTVAHSVIKWQKNYNSFWLWMDGWMDAQDEQLERMKARTEEEKVKEGGVNKCTLGNKKCQMEREMEDIFCHRNGKSFHGARALVCATILVATYLGKEPCYEVSAV